MSEHYEAGFPHVEGAQIWRAVLAVLKQIWQLASLCLLTSEVQSLFLTEPWGPVMATGAGVFHTWHWGESGLPGS